MAKLIDLFSEFNDFDSENQDYTVIPEFELPVTSEPLQPWLFTKDKTYLTREPKELKNPLKKISEISEWANNYSLGKIRIKNIQNKNPENYSNFKKQLNKFMNKNPQYEEYESLLTDIAALESGYNQYAKNKYSSALGYFQFLNGTRKDYTNVNNETFKNDCNLQFKTAIEHLKKLESQLKGYEDLIKESRLTKLQIMYGMWWRPGSMKNYLKTGSDSFETEDGMNIVKIINRAR